MAGTTNFGPVTLNPGTRTFGPANLADTDVLADLTVDRTVPGGFNSQPATTTAQISIEQSNDGGTTWELICQTLLPGGSYVLHDGTPVNTNDVGTHLLPGTGRQARATVVISGAAVAVAGSLVIS